MRKFSYLDGVRGLAAFIVVLHHYAFAFFQTAVDGNTERAHSIIEATIFSSKLYLMIAGNFAVCIFFILSGIVLTTKFFGEGSNKSIQISAVKRYVRLGLPVFTVVMLSYLLIASGMMHNQSAAKITQSAWLASFWQGDFSLLAALKHGLYEVFTLGTSNYDPVLWTMHYELFGSFLIFMIASLFGRLTYRWVMYALVALLLLKTYYLSFVLGVVLCDLYHVPSAKKVYLRMKESMLTSILGFSAWLLAIGCGLWLGALPNDGVISQEYIRINFLNLPDDQLRVLAHTIGAVLLMGGILLSPILQKFFNTRLLQWLGKVSYAMYLLHILVIGSFSSVLFVELSFSFGYLKSFAIMLPVSLTVILIASAIFTRYIDSAAIRWSSSFYYAIRGQDYEPFVFGLNSKYEHRYNPVRIIRLLKGTQIRV